jgi:hypothetical protein
MDNPSFPVNRLHVHHTLSSQVSALVNRLSISS